MTPRAGALVLLLAGVLAGACGSADRVDRANALGREAFGRGDPTQALAYFDEALALDPDNAPAHLGRGMVHWRLNQHAQAVLALNRAIERDPDLTWAYFFRGSSLIALRRYEEGIDDFKKVTASDALPAEDLVRAHRWHAIALLNLERYDDAIDVFSRCIALQPDDPFHYVERGRVYERVGQFENARADYEQFLALNEAESEVAAEVRARLLAMEAAE